ncbi:MAG: hypothetical protein FJ257_05335 [Phycisphaerae bacterium]|nr:hypothetical protein [Phycisphaerae bacterium]
MSPAPTPASPGRCLACSRLRRGASALASTLLVSTATASAIAHPAATTRVEVDRGTTARLVSSSQDVALRPRDPHAVSDDDPLRGAVREVVLALDEPREVREALARAIDAEISSAPPLTGDKARRFPTDLARFLASENWRSPTRDLGGGEEAIDLASSVLRWKIDAVRATPEIDDATRRAAIAEEMLLLAPALAAADDHAKRSGLDERATIRLRAAVIAWSDRRVARRGDYFHPELLRPSPQPPLDLLAMVEDRLQTDPLLVTLVAQLAAETRLLRLDESTRRFREWMQSAQVDATASRIGALVEEAWLDSLSSSGSAATMPFSEPPDADPRDDDPRDDDPPVDPILRRPMPEDLASRWTRSRDEAPPKETFEQLVRDLLAPMADDPEPPIAASEDDR